MILFCHLNGDTVTVMVSRVGRLSEKPPSKIFAYKVEMRQRNVGSPLHLMKRVCTVYL